MRPFYQVPKTSHVILCRNIKKLSQNYPCYSSISGAMLKRATKEQWHNQSVLAAHNAESFEMVPLLKVHHCESPHSVYTNNNSTAVCLG